MLGIYTLSEKEGRFKVVPNDQGQSSEEGEEIHRLVRVRNPWGESKYNGEWAQEDSRWKEEWEGEGVPPPDNGTIILPFYSFLLYFSGYTVCYVGDIKENISPSTSPSLQPALEPLQPLPALTLSSIKLSTPPHRPSLLTFSLPSACPFFISLHQTNQRAFPPCRQYSYALLSLGVLHVDQKNQISSVQTKGLQKKANKDMNLRVEGLPGKYIVYIESPWKRCVNELGFSVYGPGKVDIKPLRPEDLEEMGIIFPLKKQASTSEKPKPKSTKSQNAPLVATMSSGDNLIQYMLYQQLMLKLQKQALEDEEQVPRSILEERIVVKTVCPGLYYVYKLESSGYGYIYFKNTTSSSFSVDIAVGKMINCHIRGHKYMPTIKLEGIKKVRAKSRGKPSKPAQKPQNTKTPFEPKILKMKDFLNDKTQSILCLERCGGEQMVFSYQMMVKKTRR